MNIETKLAQIIYLLRSTHSDLFFATQFQIARNKIGVFYPLCCYDGKLMARLLATRRRHSERAVGYAIKALVLLRT